MIPGLLEVFDKNLAEANSCLPNKGQGQEEQGNDREYIHQRIEESVSFREFG
jgi:hypothetical protein